MNPGEISETTEISGHFGVPTGGSKLHPFDDDRRQIILLRGTFRKFNNRLV